MPKAGGNSSAMIIARLLGTEGYSDFVHNQVERYWKKRVMNQERRKPVEQLEEAFSGVMSHLSIGERLIIGKFISMRSKMNFDTGLRIGITAFAKETDKEVFFDKPKKGTQNGDKA